MNILWEELTGRLTNNDHLLYVLLHLFVAILLADSLARNGGHIRHIPALVRAKLW